MRSLFGAILAIPQLAAWMFTATITNFARQRVDIFFNPMWVAVALIIMVVATGAVFVHGLRLYLKGARGYALAAAGAILSMTAAVGLSFVTSVVTF